MKSHPTSLRPRASLCELSVLAMFLVLAASNIPPGRAETALTNRYWPDGVDHALSQAGTNGAELVKALLEVPQSQREGLQFLIENMAEPDLQTLSAAFLLENVSLAYQAFEQAPWRGLIPNEIFLNEILPFACMNEKREAWRKPLYAQCRALVEDCQTPSEAAQRLNQKLFALLKVKYSTEREKACQSPLESMESGLATCTGLAILLVDACRSVGVPARVAGTPMWANLRGNHTWVEIWDGAWHFTGAAEPDPKGLDRGWFAGDAAQALKDQPQHALYATSFKQTGLAFPLPWARRVTWVNAVNVTDRYAAKSELSQNNLSPLPIPDQSGYVARAITKPLKPAEAAKLKKAMIEFFSASTNQQARWKFPGSLEKLLRRDEPGARRVAWEAYRTAPIHGALRSDFDAKQVRFEKHLSPFTVREVGTRPANGWPLFIAMHGGGGAPKEVNDSQWRVMQHYYRDHPEAGGYLYLALRAPDDTWNGFYTDYVYPLIANLIRQFLLFGDVDPGKVFIMGYSHGGYGAFAIGPKMPDRFAAIHASAGAPTDGETTPKTLRNTIFTYMIGEKDTAYGRIDRCRKFNEAVQELRADRPDTYPVVMEFIAGNGHTGLPDRDKILKMYPAIRNPVPRDLTWLLTDEVLQDFFWLRIPAPSKGQEIEAACRQNHVTVTTRKTAAVTVLLDGRLIDFDKPVTLELNGQTSKQKLQPSLRTLCESLQRRGDPDLAFTVELELPR